MSEERQYFYLVRDANNPRHATLVPVSRKVYDETNPVIQRTRKSLQRTGRCVCPRNKLWVCDLDCPICDYQAYGNQLSLDTPLESDGDDELTLGDTIADDSASPEAIAVDEYFWKSLLQELESVDSMMREIAELMRDHSERTTAEIMGMPRSTFKRYWAKTKKQILKFCKGILD